MVIASFRCNDTAMLAGGTPVKRFRNIERAALRKLRQLQVSTRIDDLRVPPGNRLEALVGDRAGQHSIRVNDQWRICFRWFSGAAHDVEIVDYH
jgi:proteic killer suppression protein